MFWWACGLCFRSERVQRSLCLCRMVISGDESLTSSVGKWEKLRQDLMEWLQMLCSVSPTFICQTIKEHCLKISECLLFSSEVILAVTSAAVSALKMKKHTLQTSGSKRHDPAEFHRSHSRGWEVTVEITSREDIPYHTDPCCHVSFMLTDL